MTQQDLRILCTALGFTAVVMQGEHGATKDNALRATVLANLIEEFCRSALPDIFALMDEEKHDVRQRMTNAIVQIIKQTGQCQPHNLKGEGFSSHEIAVHWPMAYALAKVELNIKDQNN